MHSSSVQRRSRDGAEAANRGAGAGRRWAEASATGSVYAPSQSGSLAVVVAAAIVAIATRDDLSQTRLLPSKLSMRSQTTH